MKGLMRRIRGWLGNALVWGVTWSLATIPLVGMLWWLDGSFLAYGIAPRIAWTLFSMGFVAGGSFSTYLGLAYRHRGIGELSPGLFAVVGGAFAGMLPPIFTLLPGLAMFLGASIPEALAWTSAISALLGAGTAYATVRIAQAPMLVSGTRFDAISDVDTDLLSDGAA